MNLESNNFQNKKWISEQEYRPNINYINKKDKEGVILETELDEEFFKNLEIADEMSNKTFTPHVFHVKQIIEHEKEVTKEQKKLEVENKYHISDKNSKMSSKKNLRNLIGKMVSNKVADSNAEKCESNISDNKNIINNEKAKKDNNAFERKANNFISNLLGGKKASILINNQGSLVSSSTNCSDNLENSKFNSLIETSKLQPYMKSFPIRLTISNDSKIKPYDMMFQKVKTLNHLESAKIKIFKMIKSLKQTAEVGDLIFRLSKKFSEFNLEGNCNFSINECYEFCIRTYFKLNNEELRIAEVYKSLSIFYLRDNPNPEISLKFIIAAMDFYNQKLGEFSYDYAECLIHQGYIFESVEKVLEAEVNFERSLEIYKKVFFNLAKENFNNKTTSENLNQEIILKDQLIEFRILKSQIKKEIADCYFRLAHIYETTKNSNESIQLYRMAYLVYTRFFDTENNNFCASCLFNIGNSLMNQRLFDSAREYYEKALVIYNYMEKEYNMNNEVKIKSSDSLDTMIKIAKFYYEMDQKEESIDYLENIIWEILIFLERKNANNFISQSLEYNLNCYKYIKERPQDLKPKEINNLLLKCFLEKFYFLTDLVEEEYIFIIFQIIELLCDIHLKAKDILSLLLALKIYIFCSPAVSKYIEVAYSLILSIFKSYTDDDISMEIIEKLDSVLSEFLKIFDMDSSDQEEELYNFNDNNQNLVLPENSEANFKQNTNTNEDNIITKLNNNNNNNNNNNDHTNNNMKNTSINLNVNTKNETIIPKDLNFSNILTTNNNMNLLNSLKQIPLTLERQADMLCEIGNHCSRVGLVKMAIAYYTKAISYYTKNDNKSHLAILSDLYNNLAIEYELINQMRLSLVNFIRSLKLNLILHGENSLKTAGAHNNIGIIQDKLGNFSEALLHFTRCMEIKKIHLKEKDLGMAFSLYNVGMMNIKLGNYKEAINYLTKVEEIYKEKSVEDTNYFFCLYSFGEVYYLLNNYESAIYYFNILNSKINNLEQIALKEQKENNSINTDNSEEFLPVLSDEILEIKFSYKLLLGVCLSTTKNYKDAVFHLNYAMKNLSAEYMDSKKYYTFGLIELARSYENINDPINALRYYNELYDLVQDKWSQEEIIILHKKRKALVYQLF